jgi:hypothetical protein
MEEEINDLLNTTSLTDIILKYDIIEDKIHTLEKTMIDICNDNKVNNITNKVNNITNKDKLSKLKKIIDKTTDSKIKESTIEDLIEQYKLISNLCGHN